MSTHTPGPWRVQEVEEFEGFYIVPPDGYGEEGLDLIAEFHPYILSDAERKEVEANARLIASAPALLAACKAAERVISEHHPGGIVHEILRAAIAGAEEGSD